LNTKIILFFFIFSFTEKFKKGLFTHWAWLFELDYNLITIEYGTAGVVVKVYLNDEYNNAYWGLMGDSTTIYHKEIEDFEEYRMDDVLRKVEEIINEKDYKISSYNVKQKSCQTFVHDLSEDLVTSIDFPWVYPLEYDYKVRQTIIEILGLDDLKFVPNKYFPNPVPKWLAHSRHSQKDIKKMLEDYEMFEENHFKEYTIRT